MSDETGAEPISLRGWNVAHDREILRGLRWLRAFFAWDGRPALAREVDAMIAAITPILDEYAAELEPGETVPQIQRAAYALALEQFRALLAPYLPEGED